jgi:hypothetical protein
MGPLGEQTLIGNGVVYYGERIKSGDSNGYWLTAVDLGAPFMDSAWPSSAGWPDGSRRARPRAFPPPLLTLVRQSATAGVLIDAGIESGGTYYVETKTNATGLWKAVGTLTGQGYGAQFVDPTPADKTLGIYRIRSFE